MEPLVRADPIRGRPARGQRVERIALVQTFCAYVVVKIWVSFWENEELAVGQRHTGSAAAGTVGQAGLSFLLTFGIVKLPA